MFEFRIVFDIMVYGFTGSTGTGTIDGAVTSEFLLELPLTAVGIACIGILWNSSEILVSERITFELRGN
jgi:hypothetical protein